MAKNKNNSPQKQHQQQTDQSIATVENPLAVSGNGNYFAVSSLDGQLFVWDTLSSELVAQYTPSAHLSATCVRISWADSNVASNIRNLKSSNHPGSPTKRRKKLKTESPSDIQDLVGKLSLLALGTENGTILLYSVTKNELHSQLIGHGDRVNDISWYPANDSIFSCSNDNYVIEWRISSSKVKSKHILDRSRINAICALDSQNLLTASNSIKWWNWQSKQLLKTFNGHSTEVSFIKPILFDNFFNCDDDNNHQMIEDGDDHKQLSYFISSAVSDRYLNAWELDSKSKDNNSVASFALDDAPISLELAYSSPSSPVYLLTISRTGFLYIFEHLFSQSKSSSTTSNRIKSNGYLKSPIVPKIKLQINVLNKNSAIRSTRKSSTIGSMRQLPFLCAHLNSESLPSLNDSSSSSSVISQNVLFMIGYGSTIHPTFERVSIGDCEKISQKQDGILERSADQVPGDRLLKPTVVDKTSHNKIRGPANADSNNDKVTVIGPAGLVPNQPLFNGNSKSMMLANGAGVGGDEELSDINDDDIDVIEVDDDDINNNCPKNDKQQKNNYKNTSVDKEEEELTLGEKLNILKNNNNSTSEQQQQNNNSNKRKRKQLSKKNGGDGNGKSTSQHANTDSLVNVLIQGLQSQDKTMLNTVLNGGIESVTTTKDGKDGDLLLSDGDQELLIRNTIRKLPVEFVPGLMVELQRGLFKNGEHQKNYLKWISLVMQIKISYLMTMPNISREFLALKQLLSARTSILERCYQLKGRLDIMLSQVKSDKRTDRLTRTMPKLSYESESSESSDVEDDDNDEEEEDANDDMMDDDTLDNLIDGNNSGDDDEDVEEDEDDDSGSEDSDEEMVESAKDSSGTGADNRMINDDDSADDEESDDSDSD